MNDSYWKADYYSIFLPVVYCSGCQEIRSEEEMANDLGQCFYCN